MLALQMSESYFLSCFNWVCNSTVLCDASNQNLFLHKISWSRKTELEAHDCDQKSVDLETTTPVVETGKALQLKD